MTTSLLDIDQHFIISKMTHSHKETEWHLVRGVETFCVCYSESDAVFALAALEAESARRRAATSVEPAIAWRREPSAWGYRYRATPDDNYDLTAYEDGDWYFSVGDDQRSEGSEKTVELAKLAAINAYRVFIGIPPIDHSGKCQP